MLMHVWACIDYYLELACGQLDGPSSMHAHPCINFHKTQAMLTYYNQANMSEVARKSESGKNYVKWIIMHLSVWNHRISTHSIQDYYCQKPPHYYV